MDTIDLAAYRVNPVRGFLPAEDPLERLPADFDAWERIAPDVPALLMTGRLRPALEALPLLNVEPLQDEMQLERAMLLLSVFGNAYVWAGPEPARTMPRAVAVPWCRLAERLGRPPIAAHPSTVLFNWRRVDKTGPIELDNLATLQLFLGGMDEQWFYLTAVVIEAKGAPALGALVTAQQAVAGGRADDLAARLETIASALARVYEVLERIPEKCDPYIFYHRVRPYQTGWPEPGVIYEGVSEAPRMCTGGSAAQSPLIQALDAGLGIKHRGSETSPFLMEMRSYMVTGHRRFIEALESGPSVRQFVLDRAAQCPGLVDRYNACIRELDRFRKKHMELAVRYISHQAPNPDEAKGTGGTHFVSFLSKARKETEEHTIRE